MFRVLVLLALSLCVFSPDFPAPPSQRPLRIAMLDFGKTVTGRLVADQLAHALAVKDRKSPGFQVMDRDQARAAALGAGYQGSLNMSLQETRDLASAIGCDFFFTGDAQTLRRSPSEGPAYSEAYAAIYLASGRTGKLISWERVSVHRPDADAAEKALLQKLAEPDVFLRYQKVITRTQEDESAERAAAVETTAPIVEVMSDDQSNEAMDVRAPRPFRRLKPPYPETAARAEVEATVDVLIDIDAGGEVGRVEIARWAGYGLDQSVIDTVKQLHFFPAMREGIAIPMRVLLRYNFRKPPKQDR
ncbi:MAG TPA: energy transducer TonB [Pyrinomonadaceae bacterium]|nr:energy transducer TonB [Pyrinomonadaceae bacterium]